MRTLLVTLMIGPPVVILLAMFMLRLQLRRFQRDVPVIRAADDLVRLKRLAAIQMYAALGVLPLLPVPLLVWLYGIFIAGLLSWMDLLSFVVLPFAAIVAGAFLMGGPAEEVQAISVEDAALQAERDHVIDVWLNRMLPKW